MAEEWTEEEIIAEALMTDYLTRELDRGTSGEDIEDLINALAGLPPEADALMTHYLSRELDRGSSREDIDPVRALLAGLPPRIPTPPWWPW
jgi:hypothetical protein